MSNDSNYDVKNLIDITNKSSVDYERGLLVENIIETKDGRVFKFYDAEQVNKLLDRLMNNE